MLPLYNRNGLVFWSEKEILIRENFKNFFAQELKDKLKELNSAFEFIQVEAPILTPIDLISSSYTTEDYFSIDDLVLRPETTMGSYIAAKQLLNTHNDRRVRMPLCVWQCGKSFRQEQDKNLSNMRLKEFYQLEFQCIFAENTANDYYPHLVNHVHQIISKQLGDCRIEQSDRLPSYSQETQDVILSSNDMEICSMSRRTDFEGAKVIEIAIGLDRCLFNF